MSVDLGDTYTTSIEVYTAPPELGGVLTNAGTVALTITLPDGTTTSPAPTNTSTGKYKYDLVTTQAGRHLFRWQTTNPATAFTDTADVRPAEPGYIVSLAETKAHLNIPSTVTTHDEELRRHIGSATGVVEGHIGPVVRRTVSAERHPGGCYAVVLHHTEVISVTSVTPVATGGTAVTVADLDVDPAGIIRYKDGYTAFPYGMYLWTYVVGRVTIPDEVVLAALIIVKHLWETQRGGTITVAPGEEVLDPRFGFAVPRRAIELLRPHEARYGVA